MEIVPVYVKVLTKREAILHPEGVEIESSLEKE